MRRGAGRPLEQLAGVEQLVDVGLQGGNMELSCHLGGSRREVLEAGSEFTTVMREDLDKRTRLAIVPLHMTDIPLFNRDLGKGRRFPGHGRIDSTFTSVT